MEIIDFILLIILVIVNFYLIYKINSTENFESINDALYQQINTKYSASIDSIRELSSQINEMYYNVDSVSLYTPTTVAYNLDVKPKMEVSDDSIIEKDLIVDGDVLFINKDDALLNILPKYMILLWNKNVLYSTKAPLGWAFCDGKKYILDEDGFAVENIYKGIQTIYHFQETFFTDVLSLEIP